MSFKYKYLKYKNLYLNLKYGGKCRPFSTKDCDWNPNYDKCSQVEYNSQRNQSQCICNHISHQCVSTNNAAGMKTLETLKKMSNKNMNIN